MFEYILDTLEECQTELRQESDLGWSKEEGITQRINTRKYRTDFSGYQTSEVD